MRLEFQAVSERRPGLKWRRVFAQGWPGWREWQQRQATENRPSLADCERALARHMPELVSVWHELVELSGGSDDAARFLSFWCPPRYLASCSQAVGFDSDGPFLIRNYDLDPALNEATLLHSAWKGRWVIATVEGIAGAADGINEAGLAVSITFGGRTNIGRGFGIPLIVRYLLEICSTTPEAVEALRCVPSHMSYNVTVVDRGGEFATVFLSPDRPAIVTRERTTTNHQLDVEWPAHARRSRTIERKEFLGHLFAGDVLGCDQVVGAFLHPPLFNTQYREGFGTVYTALYRPAEGSATLLWPRQPPWRKTLGRFAQDSRLVEYRTEREQTIEMPESWVAATHQRRLDAMLAYWGHYLPEGFAEALAANVRDPVSADWPRLGAFWDYGTAHNTGSKKRYR
jgi:predicted choloylglycine hydrolase